MPSDLLTGPIHSIRDRAFASVFPRLFIYTILFEDNERDLEFLSLGEDDRSSPWPRPGCGVAAFLASPAARIDVVDFNRSHLALTALKVSAARTIGAYDEFHELPGPRPPRTAPRGGLPPRGRTSRRASPVLALGPLEDVPQRPLLARAPAPQPRPPLAGLADLARLSAAAHRPAARGSGAAEIEPLLRRHLGHWALAALLDSPVALLAAGINYMQRDRNLRADRHRPPRRALVEYALPRRAHRPGPQLDRLVRRHRGLQPRPPACLPRLPPP